MKANVLVVGGGGREDAIVWKLSRSDNTENLYCIPGNGGITRRALIPENFPSTNDSIIKFAKEKSMDFVVVGPEQPLAEGLADGLRALGISVLGPGSQGARLEGSKSFAKNFMKKYNVPTAEFEIFSDSTAALDYLKTKEKVVIKADGLCAGKGVYVCSSREEATAAVREIMQEKKFSEAGNKIIIEDMLRGEEASIIVLMSPDNYSVMLPSQDHKAVFEGDSGPNTGGMGAYAPTGAVNPEILKKVEKNIIGPVSDGLRRERIDYRGVLYIGLMICDGEPQVLEFNVRFGDPETEAMLPLLKTDFIELLSGVERDEKVILDWEKQVCVDVVLASGGYPGSYESGKKIKINREDMPEGVNIFHAGTQLKNGKLYTSGGRVLNVAARGNDIVEAVRKAYKAIESISFENMYFRKDIGHKEVKRYECGK